MHFNRDVKKAKDHFGNSDVLINDAGYGLFGTIEEIDEQEARGRRHNHDSL